MSQVMEPYFKRYSRPPFGAPPNFHTLQQATEPRTKHMLIL